MRVARRRGQAAEGSGARSRGGGETTLDQAKAEANSGAHDAQIRASIGLIVPSANTRVEPDCYRIAPADVTVHSARMLAFEMTDQALADMVDGAEQAAHQLATADVNVVAFACTTGSMVSGVGYDVGVAKRIENAAGVPAITTATAVVDALHSLGVEAIAVGTPYPDWMNELVQRFLAESGFGIVSLQGLGIPTVHAIARTPPSAVYELGRSVDRPEAEAVFLSCTNFRAAEVADRLERELGKPVITSNQATIWAALRRAGVADGIAGYGRLLLQHNGEAAIPGPR